MAKALTPQNSRIRGVVFELDRFELAPGRQCELEGRWFGVRGRRFIRPALTLIGQERQARLLADLVHKPWEAEEGEPWEAAFEGSLENVELLEAELTVAPDITITLPLPKSGVLSDRTKPPGGRVARPQGARQTAPTARGTRDQQRSPDRTADDRIGALKAELAKTQSELRRLRSQLASAQVENKHVAARLDGLLGELQQAAQDRDRAQEARDEATAERDAAIQALEVARDQTRAAQAARDCAHIELDAAHTAQQQAVRERDAALAGRGQARSERDAALAARAQAISERDAARSALNTAQAERDSAIKAADDVGSQLRGTQAALREAEARLDDLRQDNQGLRSELAQRKAAHGAALVMRHATADANTRYRIGASRAVAISALIVILLLLALMTGFVTV